MQNQTRTRDVKLVSIGNSKGIRIPKTLLQKYGFDDYLLLKETEQGLLIMKKNNEKSGWEETYKAMAKESEDWDDFELTIFDGLEENSLDD